MKYPHTPSQKKDRKKEERKQGRKRKLSLRCKDYLHFTGGKIEAQGGNEKLQVF